MAVTLSAAAAAGSLPRKWGGVFGQEWLTVLDAPPVPPALPAPPAAAPAAEPGAAATGVPPAAASASAQIEQLLRRLSLQELLDCAAAASAAAASRCRADGGGGGGSVESVAVEEAEEAPKFRAVRPFHPGRLHAALQRLASPDVPEERGLRLEGIAWLATQPNLQGLVSTNEAGACVVEPGDPWWAVIPRSKWPEGLEDAIAPLWHEPHGDRQSEVALVWPDDAAEGRCTPSALHAARERWFATLEACVMKPSEDELPLDELDDPFADAWAPVLREAAEQERLAKIADDVHTAFARARARRRRPASNTVAPDAAAAPTQAAGAPRVAPLIARPVVNLMGSTLCRPCE